MFRETSPQRALFGVETRMDPVKRARLERTWAHQYRNHALPLIDEKQFAKYFDPGNGRPNKSIRLVVSVLIFKEMFNLTDEEALEQLEWNNAWYYALDFTPEEAHACRKTLHNFRRRLLEDDEGAALFESTTARLIEAAGLRTGRQRQDSTHILSNIKVLTRLGLFVDTITQFLKKLRDEHPRLCDPIKQELAGKYLDREGYFADARSTEAQRRLQEAALDLYWLVKKFEAHKTVKKMPSFELVARLYCEQCVPPDSEWVDRIELQKKPDSSSLQSPSDPDATYGHKGKGYEAQLAETCDKENGFQVVTAVDVNGANESDQQHVEPILEQTERTCGEAPDEMYGDSGFASGENILKAREHGTELVAPIGAKESEKHLPMRQFTFDDQGERVLSCPAGKSPMKHQPNRTGSAMLACFSAKQCRRCPLRKQCPTQRRRGKLRVLRFTRADVAVAQRRIEQETPDFKERYKIRSGIEATNSELKRRHGLAKLRVRGRKRVGLSARLKIIALNFKRYVNFLAEIEVVATPAPACNC
jgi:hypothetical protein